jgi:hypothetical protein
MNTYKVVALVVVAMMSGVLVSNPPDPQEEEMRLQRKKRNDEERVKELASMLPGPSDDPILEEIQRLDDKSTQLACARKIKEADFTAHVHLMDNIILKEQSNQHIAGIGMGLSIAGLVIGSIGLLGGKYSWVRSLAGLSAVVSGVSFFGLYYWRNASGRHCTDLFEKKSTWEKNEETKLEGWRQHYQNEICVVNEEQSCLWRLWCFLKSQNICNRKVVQKQICDELDKEIEKTEERIKDRDDVKILFSVRSHLRYLKRDIYDGKFDLASYVEGNFWNQHHPIKYHRIKKNSDCNQQLFSKWLESMPVQNDIKKEYATAEKKQKHKPGYEQVFNQFGSSVPYLNGVTTLREKVQEKQSYGSHRRSKSEVDKVEPKTRQYAE